MHSFRFRLALISVVTSGLVLVAFGAVAWTVLVRNQLAAVDEGLAGIAMRTATRATARVEPEKLESAILERVGVAGAEHRFFAIVNENSDEVVFQSEGWPEGVAATEFLPGEAALDPQPVFREPPVREVARGKGTRVQRGGTIRSVFEPSYFTVGGGGARSRIGVFANPEVRILVGADLNAVAGEMIRIRNAFLVALPGALLVIAAGGLIVARRALRPIEVLGDRMEKVSVEGLDQRLELRRADGEFRQIIEAYNHMMERLEKSFHQATRFSADASHQLKTPLAVMQGTLERAIANSADDGPEQKVYSGMLEEVGNQRAILESLLLLSRVDAGELRLSREAVDLSGLMTAVAEDAGMLAEARGIEVRSEIEGGIEVQADSVLLQQVLHNLASNAVKYNRDRGVVEIGLKKSAGGVELSVANSGEGIREADREKVFERFYRANTGEGVEGVGLGLSLAREIVLAHGGSILAEASSDEAMTVFRVRLPF